VCLLFHNSQGKFQGYPWNSQLMDRQIDRGGMESEPKLNVHVCSEGYNPDGGVKFYPNNIMIYSTLGHNGQLEIVYSVKCLSLIQLVDEGLE